MFVIDRVGEVPRRGPDSRSDWAVQGSGLELRLLV